MVEIRLHGRAGQGMVTGAELIALAAFYEGKYSQAFPFFGSEKRGPPVMAFCRVSEEPITVHEEISEPDIVVVADSSILDAVDVTAGLKEEGILIINSKKTPSELGFKVKNVYTINASDIALKHFKKLILNTVMLGAFCKVTKLVSLESIKKAIKEKLSEKLPEKVVEANLNAIQEIYDLMEASK